MVKRVRNEIVVLTAEETHNVAEWRGLLLPTLALCDEFFVIVVVVLVFD